jgi:hypothetical protein
VNASGKVRRQHVRGIRRVVVANEAGQGTPMSEDHDRIVDVPAPAHTPGEEPGMTAEPVAEGSPTWDGASDTAQG